MTTVEANLPISNYPVHLKRSDLRKMLHLVRTLYRLGQNPNYQATVFSQSPEIVQFDPGHDAVMMGYDFHLTDSGPQLIEVNTNAGGSYLALQADANLERHNHFYARALATFTDDYARYSGTTGDSPRTLVILDEHPQEQFLYPEMLAFAKEFEKSGIRAWILDPRELQADVRGVTYRDTNIDMIYNRHCDFYLQSPEMEGIRKTYLAGNVCLSPNPRAYGLFADKRRMVSWHDPESHREWGLTPREPRTLLETIPECTLLSGVDKDEMWAKRKKWVFKPTTLFGSRGVLLGEKTTHKRFEELDPETTLCQRLVRPQKLTFEDGKAFKADLRLFVYRDKLLGITARLYRGQVTNMRTEGGGFAQVIITDE